MDTQYYYSPQWRREQQEAMLREQQLQDRYCECGVYLADGSECTCVSCQIEKERNNRDPK